MFFSLQSVQHPQGQHRAFMRMALPAMQMLGVVGALWASESWAINIPEGTSKLQMATEIDRTYLRSLGLNGKPAAQSIGTLLAEGFRCSLMPVSPYALDTNPRAYCFKQPSGWGSLCDEHSVTLKFESQLEFASTAEMLLHLDEVKVKNSGSFCPYKREASAEYLAGRSAGEKVLDQQVHAFNLVGNAKSVFDKLLIEGYSCGFNLDPTTLRPPQSPKLICTKAPSLIKLCFEPTIVMDVEWAPNSNPASLPWDALKSAEVKSYRASCEVPSIKKGQGEML